MNAEQQILKVIDRLHGAYWSDFVKEISLPKEEIQIALRSLLKKRVIRQKEDDIEHDWEYIRL